MGIKTGIIDSRTNKTKKETKLKDLYVKHVEKTKDPCSTHVGRFKKRLEEIKYI